MFMIILFLI